MSIGGSSGSFGSPTQLAEVIGPRAERRILRIVAAAYETLSGMGRVDNSWDEDRITKDLCTQIALIWRQVSPSSVSNLVPMPQFPIHPKPSRRGRAPTIDFVFWRGYSEEVYFAFECKLVDDSDQSSLSEYIDEGMNRYIEGKYAIRMPRGGMVGYLFYSQVNATANAINSEMLAHSGFSQNDFLTQATFTLNGFKDLYVSSHIRRNTRTPFKIYHLFLVF